jgi:hypothetical protein
MGSKMENGPGLHGDECSFQIDLIQRFYFQEISPSMEKCSLFLVLWGATHVSLPVRDPQAENDASEPYE